MPDSLSSGADDERDTRSTSRPGSRRRSPSHGDTRPHSAKSPSTGNGETKTKPAVYAAVDLGTNNCRLLVAKATPHGRRNIRVIDSYSEVVKLGHNLTSTGRLADASMDASVEALKVCAEKIHRRGVSSWRCVATQACRQADNGEEFIARVKREVGLSLEIISPRIEARLSVMGCLNLVDTRKHVALVVDIGGGSTELSWVDIRRLKTDIPQTNRPPISAWASIPVGVATLSEMYPEHNDRTQWYADMKAKVRECLLEQRCDTRFTNVFKAGKGHIIGTSGTITSLAGVHLKLPYYQRKHIDGLWMPTQSAVDIARELASKSISDRAKVPSIGEDRASLLVAGCAIMDVLCELWPAERIRVADRGLREGILMGLMHAPKGQGRRR